MSRRRRPLLRACAPAALLVLLFAGAAVGRAAGTEARITDFTYNPNPITVRAGDTVTWTNEDRAAHTVTVDGVFNSGQIKQGERYTLTATAPGTFAYYCIYHPFMKGTLVVEGGQQSRFFPETGKTVASPFLAYWETHGGLPINGYPLSDALRETLEDGREYTVQYFERVRLEFHPENSDPRYQVLLGQFGRRIHPADPPTTRQPGATYFDETGHNLSGAFLAYWQENGGLAGFGFPISEPFTEMLEDGKLYTVQYFERARFELHPDNAAPYDVLLGQFGRHILAGR